MMQNSLESESKPGKCFYGSSYPGLFPVGDQLVPDPLQGGLLSSQSRELDRLVLKKLLHDLKGWLLWTPLKVIPCVKIHPGVGQQQLEAVQWTASMMGVRP